MSNEDKHIDKLFKEKLADRSFNEPSPAFLNDLNKRLDERKSRRWIWIVFLNLLIISLLIANATIDSSPNKAAEIESQIENQKLRTQKEKLFDNENVQRDTISVNRDDSKTNNAVGKEKLNNTEGRLTELETNQDNSVEGTDSNTEGSVGVKNTSASASNNKNTEESRRNIRSESDRVLNNSSDSKDQIPKGSNSPEDKEPAESGGVVGEVKTDKTASSETDAPINNVESLYTNVSYSAIYAPEFEEVVRIIEANDFQTFSIRWSDTAADDSNDTSDKSTKKEEDKRMFEIQLHGGATQWSNNTFGTNSAYVDQLDAAGTPKWTPNFGLALNANFNNISIGTGIDYANFKTLNLFEFSEVNTYDSTYIAGYNETITYDSLGNPVDTTSTAYYDSTTVTDTTFSTNQITNQYEWIQIPLHIGYRFSLNKWAIIPRVGMNIGIGIRQSSGQYPTETYDDLQTLSAVKWNLNLLASLEFQRTFGNWHAFGKLNYQRNLTPTISNALFERKFNGVGFNFGVGYSF